MTHISGFEPINLDDCCTDHADMFALSDALAQLAAYAGHKAAAMKMRGADGEMEVALAHERCCDDLYKRLPAWAKW